MNRSDPGSRRRARRSHIASTGNISIQPLRPVRHRSPRTGGHGITAALRACRVYFDWHPVLGGVVMAVVTTIGVTGAFRVFEEIIPVAGGWAICTPLNGMVLAMLLMSRRKLWLWILLGYLTALLGDAALARPAHRMGGLAIFGNLLELLIAAFTLPPFRNFKQWLLEPRLMRAFAAYALLLGPLVLGLTLARRYSGLDGAFRGLPASFWERVRIVGFAEALGIALGTSLVLVLANRRTYKLFRWHALPETLGLFALLGLATWFAFTLAIYPVIFVPYAVLLMIAYRRGLRGAVLGCGILSSILIALNASGHSPSLLNAPGSMDATHSALLVQSYLALAVVAVFPLGVTLFKQQHVEELLADQQGQVERLKAIDRLTGVSNRKRFDLVLAREWQRATRDPKPIALLLIDIDEFKQFNDCYGYQAGDACLRLIATKMTDQPQRPYDLISRYEGGKFSVLLPGASGDAVKTIAEEFRSEIAALEWPHERSQFSQVTVSVGWVSMLPARDLEPHRLIDAAEQALATAKAKGKNRVEGYHGNAVEAVPAQR